MAKTASKTRTKGSNLPVPQTIEAAASAIFRLGEIDRILQRQDADLKDALAKVKATYEEAAEPFRQEQQALVEGVKIFCEANRDTLTGGGKSKTVLFTTGNVSWRLRPPSVKLRGGEQAVLDAISASLNPLMRAYFVRTKQEVSREGMLANPELALQVPGVSITSEGEDFTIEPFTPDGITGRAA